jgi:SAM-dependent methyltransferase
MTSPEADKWLDRVFTASSTQVLADAYDEWAASYDADMLAIGYLHPAVAAGLVGRHVRHRDARILDAGAGTGILGQVLSIMGYANLVALDMSIGMLIKAGERGVYRELRTGTLGERLDFADQSFAVVVSTGVFTVGHAPASALEELVRITRPGGHLIFTVGTPAWEAGGYRERLERLESERRCRLVEATEHYRPMPLSSTEGAFTSRMFVYQVA